MKKYILGALLLFSPVEVLADTCFVTGEFFCATPDAKHKFHAFVDGKVQGKGQDCKDWGERRRLNSFIKFLNKSYPGKLLPQCNNRKKITFREVRVIVWGPASVANRNNPGLKGICKSNPSYDRGCKTLDKFFEMGSWE